jgi:predicted branched-subunit amino acid permease
MPLRPAMIRHPEFMAGVRAMAPQVPGMAAWGLMTGVAMVKSGLSLTEALAMALLVYAGSSQLASLPLLVAGAPFWVILGAGFCVNLRFVVFSLHLRDYLVHLPRAQRLLAGYLSTDMGYVLLTQRHPQAATDAMGRDAQLAHLMGICACNWIFWVVPSLAGVLLSNFIPTEWGLGFAGLLCLIGILCSLATTRLRIVAAVIAGATAIVAYSLPLKLNIVLAIGVAVLACVALETRPRWRPAQP